MAPQTRSRSVAKKRAKSLDSVSSRLLRSLRRAIALAAILYVYKFVRDTGELRTLSDISIDGCVRELEDKRGFEDFATFPDGSILSLASDHHHFKFEFGKSMREMIQRKRQGLAAV